MVSSSKITQGDIWLIDFEPTKGQEIFKVRPAIVIDSEEVGYHSMRMVVPIRSWKQGFDEENSLYGARWLLEIKII